MKRRVEILSQKEVFARHFFHIKEVRFRHECYNGQMSDVLTRLNFERGDSAAAIVHDPKADKVIFTEQFRYSAYEKGPGWLLEIPAGTIESGEVSDPRITLRRELMEEIGYEVSQFRKIASFYVSPGATSERIHLYYAAATPTDHKGKGGGLHSEGEDIRLVAMSVAEALKKVETGEIVDAKTIIGLQWLQMQRGVK